MADTIHFLVARERAKSDVAKNAAAVSAAAQSRRAQARNSLEQHESGDGS